jgi:hypothetical protein
MGEILEPYSKCIKKVSLFLQTLKFLQSRQCFQAINDNEFRVIRMEHTNIKLLQKLKLIEEEPYKAPMEPVEQPSVKQQDMRSAQDVVGFGGDPTQEIEEPEPPEHSLRG